MTEQEIINKVVSLGDTFLKVLVSHLPSALLAIFTLLVGFRVIAVITKAASHWMDKRELDPSLKSFFQSAVGVVLKVLLFLSVAGIVGVETTSFVAILGSAGIAVGLALQGSLSNFAGGVLILILRPFRVGDSIDALGFTGTVKEIQIFYTVVNTFDNKRIILPNGSLANTNITNISFEPKRRHDWVIGIGYGDNIKTARDVLLKVMNADERLHKDPAPVVYVTELADSSVNLTARAWSDKEVFWDVKVENLERFKLALDEAGVSIPFPQRDVHMING